MSALKSYWEGVGNLRPDQAAKLPTVEWLLDSSQAGSVRRSGRSTLMALAFLRGACSHPGSWVPVFDHFRPMSKDDGKRMLDTVRTLGREEALDCKMTPHPSIRVRSGWSHTVLDPVQGPSHVLRLEEATAFPVLEGGADPGTVLEDVRASAAAAIKLGVPADAVVDAVRDAVVRTVMED